MRTEPTIAEILHHAADYCLWDGAETSPWREYSCNAIEFAAFELTCCWDTTNAVMLRVDEGLREMGLNTDSTWEFSEFTGCINRQAARHNWLKFAALIAEEQNV